MPSSLFPCGLTRQHNPMSTPAPQLLNTMAMPQSQQVQNQQQQNNQEQILQVWNLVKNSTNPEQAMATIMEQNPSFKKVVETINAFGNPKKLFYERVKQQGVDPNSILSLLK